MRMKNYRYNVAFSRHCGLHQLLPLQLMKAAVPAECYILSIIFHRRLYTSAMSTASNQVGAALFPSF